MCSFQNAFCALHEPNMFLGFLGITVGLRVIERYIARKIEHIAFSNLVMSFCCHYSLQMNFKAYTFIILDFSHMQFQLDLPLS